VFRETEIRGLERVLLDGVAVDLGGDGLAVDPDLVGARAVDD